MAQNKVVVCCWLHGHRTELNMTLRQQESLVQKIKKLKAVCPMCRDQGLGNQAIFILEGRTLFDRPKGYRCERGHACTLSAFGNGMLHMCFGPNTEDFVNVQGKIEELPELIDSKDISCHHVVNDQPCDGKLSAVDNFVLSYPTPVGIKTKTRIGDLWDRAGVEPVRQGTYDKDGNYRGTRTEIANRQRLKQLRKNRNTPVDRQPGRRIDRPTNKTYDRRSKSEINPERLNGPK